MPDENILYIYANIQFFGVEIYSAKLKIQVKYIFVIYIFHIFTYILHKHFHIIFFLPEFGLYEKYISEYITSDI